ncbi:hypothetical protein PFLUV_G00079920 [Perca fluviatilis]|uniref:Alpha-galactosidase n=1 Tax=Perca fluviatilis TaxID=8168 RepID=A0A6A5EE80_PERFL|nr:hypothetical protein PFLUV_G00079920 [Perca fluviatilis]
MGLLAATPLLVMISLTVSLDNGLLKTPPMGWMAWERFRCDIDCKDDPENCIGETLFRDMADRLAEDGWKELGYEYVIIDDCWMSMLRDELGRLQPEPSSLVFLSNGQTSTHKPYNLLGNSTTILATIRSMMCLLARR